MRNLSLSLLEDLVMYFSEQTQQRNSRASVLRFVTYVFVCLSCYNNVHELVCFKQQTLIFYSSGFWEVPGQGQTDLVSGEHPHPKLSFHGHLTWVQSSGRIPNIGV